MGSLSDAWQAFILVSVTVPIALLAAMAYRRSGRGEEVYHREIVMQSQVTELKDELAKARVEIKNLKATMAEQERQMTSFRLSAARCQAAQVALLEAASALTDQIRKSGQIPAIDINTLMLGVNEGL